MTHAIDITAEQRRTILTLLERHLPGTTAWVHGSRVQRTSRPTSDLDLVVFATPEQDRRVGDLREAFEESDLPFPVDLFVWDEIPENFHKKIKSEYEVLIKTNHRDSECGWQEATLGECAFLVKSSVYPESCGESHYIGLEHIGEGSLSLLGHGKASDVESVKSRFLCGDILFGKLRPYFRKVIRARFDGICSTDIWVIRPSDGVVAEYLFYVISSKEFVDFATQGTEGTRMPRAQWEHTSRFQIRIPPLPEQRAIARILGALDDKIELNRRMNETLEAMARTLFKSWFVDFDPVRAKAEGRDTGLPDHIADLFPDRLVDSEIGGIPEGWRVGRLGDIANTESRTVNPEDVHEDTPYIGLEHMPRRSIALTEWEGAGKVKSNKSHFKTGDILFGKLRPYFHKVGIAPLDGICSTDIVVVRPKSYEWCAMVLFCLSTDQFVDFTSQISTGTKMPRTNWKAMVQYELALPPLSLASEHGRIMQPTIDRIVANIHGARILATLRETLIPKLMSGEVRLGEAEKIVGMDMADRLGYDTVR